MPVFDTTAFAAPVISLIAAAVTFLVGYRLLLWRQRVYGPGYGDFADAAGTGAKGAHLPSWWIGAIPLALVLVVNLLFTFLVIPRMDTAYLAQPEWGGTTIGSVRGLWAVIAAMTVATIVLITLTFRRIFGDISKLFEEGAKEALLPMFTVASLVGFGAVIARQDGFRAIENGIIALGGDSTLLTAVLATGLLSAVTASSSGGLAATMATLGETFRLSAIEDGLSLELLHRTVAVASGIFHFMPHNGAFISTAAICGLTPKQAYKDGFLTGFMAPLAGLVVLLALGLTIGAF
jgi:H+/gluconate symporter-like permease